MDILVWLAVCSLAAFRLAELFVVDDGPFEIFVTLRGWFNAAPDDPRSLRRTIANGLTCVYCVGIWAALPLAFFLRPSNPFEFITYWFAIAGLQSVISCKFGRVK